MFIIKQLNVSNQMVFVKILLNIYEMEDTFLILHNLFILRTKFSKDRFFIYYMKELGKEF